MLHFIVLVLFATTVANAGFHKHRHFTIDMNGFHMHGHHHQHHGFGDQGRFGPPPPAPVYGPPPFGPPPFGPQFHHGHGHGHHQHTPQCNHQPGNGIGMFPFPQNTMPSSTNIMPFIPNMNNPFIHGTNFPFNQQNPFFPNPNQINGNIPFNFGQNNFGFDQINNPSNLPLDPLPTSNSIFNTNTMTPLDANTALDDHSSTTPSGFGVYNGDNQPQYPNSPPTEAKGSPVVTDPSDTNQNNDNNYNGTGAIAPNNAFDSVDEPSAVTTTTTSPPDQGKYNGLDYDIDVRFSDGKSDNRTNQKPSDTL